LRLQVIPFRKYFHRIVDPLFLAYCLSFEPDWWIRIQCNWCKCKSTPHNTTPERRDNCQRQSTPDPAKRKPATRAGFLSSAFRFLYFLSSRIPDTR